MPSYITADCTDEDTCDQSYEYLYVATRIWLSVNEASLPVGVSLFLL